MSDEVLERDNGFKWRWRPLTRGTLTAPLVAAVLTVGSVGALAAGCTVPGGAIPTHETTPTVTVAVSDTIEHEVTTLIYAFALKREGYHVHVLEPAGTTSDAFSAVESGQAQLTVAYTGDALARLQPGQVEPQGSDAAFAAAAHALPPSLVAGPPAPAQDKPSLVVSRNTSDTWGLRQMSDLADRCGDLRLASTPAIAADPGVQVALSRYSCEFADVSVSFRDPGDIQKALREGRAGIGLINSTDPVLFPQDMVELRDDQGFIPAENLFPLFTRGALSAEQQAVVGKVSRKLTTSEVCKLNAAVESGSTPVAAVANYWLDENDI